jgi:hypothetical protein
MQSKLGVYDHMGSITTARNKSPRWATSINMLRCRTVDKDVSGKFQTAKKLVVKMKEVVGFSFRKWLMFKI